MLIIKEIDIVNTYSFDYWTISWTIQETGENVDNFTFDIYRANSTEGPWVRIASGLTDFSYQDTSIKFFKPSEVYFYKVEVQDIYSQERVLYDVIGRAIYRAPDNIALAVFHDETIYLERVVNNPEIYVLVKKRSGTRCTNCWDSVRRQPTKTKCNVCYGTGYEGGFYDPVPVKYCLLSGRSTLESYAEMADVSDEKFSPTQLWIQNSPIMHSGDLIIDSLNNRYEINQVIPTTKNWYVLRQILTVNLLPQSHILYTYDIGV